MNWIGIKCPVCNEKFTDNDDVVVCPVCGTPHHKQCWKENGGCINENKHEYNFEFVCPEPEKQHKPTPEEEFGSKEYDTYESDDIDGIPVSHIETYIQKNSDKYVSKFKNMREKNTKISFNIWAFLSPLLYTCYRKISKYAIMVMLLTIIISIMPSYVVPMIYQTAKPDKYTEYVTDSENFQKTITSSTSNAEVLNAAQKFAMNDVTVTVYAVEMILQLLVRLYFGLYSIYLYKQKVVSDIHMAANILKDEPQQYEQFLRSRGGGSILTLACGILVSLMISSFMSFM